MLKLIHLCIEWTFYDLLSSRYYHYRTCSDLLSYGYINGVNTIFIWDFPSNYRKENVEVARNAQSLHLRNLKQVEPYILPQDRPRGLFKVLCQIGCFSLWRQRLEVKNIILYSKFRVYVDILLLIVHNNGWKSNGLIF